MKCNGLQRALGTIILCTLTLATQAQQQAGYSLTLIGTTASVPWEPGMIVTDINDSAEVVGQRSDSAGFTEPFIWRDGVFSKLLPLSPGEDGFAVAVDDGSNVVGQFRDRDNIAHGYLRLGSGSIVEILPPHDERSVLPRDVNNQQQVLLSTTAAMGTREYLWQQGQFTLLDRHPTANSTVAERVNDQGVAIGTASFNLGRSAVLWENGMLMELPRPAGSKFASGVDVSNDGVALISAAVQLPSFYEGVFLWQAGQLTELPRLPGMTSAEALDISNGNVVVGSSFNHSRLEGAAVLWQGGAIDLNTRILSDDPLKPFVHLRRGLMINDNGFIVADGIDSRDTGDRRGFYLLTPR